MSNESVAPLRGVRVLIVEDHDDTRESLDAHLTLSGALVLTAATALEALSQVVMCDVVVTDLAMSGRDGRWLVDQVKMSARPVPVIALTGYEPDYDLTKRHLRESSRSPFNPKLSRPRSSVYLAGKASDCSAALAYGRRVVGILLSDRNTSTAGFSHVRSDELYQAELRHREGCP